MQNDVVSDQDRTKACVYWKIQKKTQKIAMQNSIVLAHVLTKKQDYDEPEHATGCDEPEHAADPQTKETVIKPRI